MIGLIPAAGDAKRMLEIPKFLLPIFKTSKTLISWHIENQLRFCEKVVIITKPENAIFFKHLLQNKKINILIVETKTMSESILRAVESFPSDKYILGMPDTYAVGENPYDILINNEDNSNMLLALWDIKRDQFGTLGQVLLRGDNTIADVKDKDIDCKYPVFWGLIKFDNKIIEHINKEDEHIGFSIMPAINSGLAVKGLIIGGRYFDCGTMEKYEKLIEFLYKH